MHNVSRRAFLKALSFGTAGATLGLASATARAGMMGGGGGGMGGGTSVIDPAPGAVFADPPEATNLSAVPGVVEVGLEAAPSWHGVGGVTAALWTYNGSFPGPTIRARRGDLLRVRFRNALPMAGRNILGHEREMTNLHTHGLHVSPAGNADNAMLMFMSGDEFVYEYDLAHQYPATLNFYHPHHHGTVAEQYWAGMAGALVIEDDLAALAGYETHLLLVKDLALAGSEPEPYDSRMDYMHGKEGSAVMVNGQVNPVLAIRPGQVQRWRVLNACNARFLKLSLEGHTLYVAGTEGGLLDRPWAVSSVLLAPGERADLLVRGSGTAGTYRLLSLPYSRGGGSAAQQVTLLTLADAGSPAADALPATLRAGLRRVNPPVAKTERIVLSMGQGRGYVNGISFSEAGAFTLTSHLGTHEVWEVVNNSGMDHPFHQHVNACQVLSVSGGDSAYAALCTRTPSWKDTVIVPKWGSVRLLVPVEHFAGMAMFHCHIVEHEDIGMMGIWDIMEAMEPM